MSEGRAVDVLARFASAGRRVGNLMFLPVPAMRRVVAASTESQLAIARLHIARGQEAQAQAIAPPDLTSTTSWAAVVFRANASALAEIDRASAPGVECAVELVGRAAYYSGRSFVPPGACADDELRWRIDSLDASLGAAAAAGIEVDADSLARLSALRRELEQRGPQDDQEGR